MKKIYTLFITICSLVSFSQAPKLINYQGVARNAAGLPITTPLKIKFELYSAQVGGTLAHSEIQTANTNSLGLFSTQIGMNSPLNIDWGTGSWFLDISIDSTNTGNSFVNVGRQRLVSVPYALYADSAGKAPSPVVTFNNNILTVGTSSVSLPSAPVYTAGTGIAINSGLIGNTAPDQTVIITPLGNAQVNSSYPNFTVNVDPQVLGINSNSITLSNGGGTVVLPSTSSTPNTSLSAAGIATVTTSGTNTFNISVASPTITGNGGTSVSGTYPNFTISSPTVAAAITPSIAGTGLANVSPASGNNFTVNVPPPSISYGGNVLTISQGTSSSAVTIPAGVTPTIAGAGIATVTPLSGNNFTVNVAPLNLTGIGSATVSGTYPNITVNTPVFSPPPPGWTLFGNGGTNAPTNFIGTTDNVPLNFRVNNQKSGSIDPLLSNTFFGYWSGRDNTTGTQNSAFGINSLVQNTTGGGNTAFGVSALGSNLTGINNTALGTNAGANSIGNGNVFLGNQAGFSETGSNKLYIANSSINPPLIFGDFATGRVGLGTIAPAAKFEVQNTIGGINGISSINASASNAHAGFFQINNPTNNFNALNATTNGAGAALNASNTYSGANSIRDGIYVTTTGSGAAGSVNKAAYFSATGAANNYAAIFDQGRVGIGTTMPSIGQLEVAHTSSSSALTSAIYSDLTGTGTGNYFGIYSRVDGTTTSPVLGVRGFAVGVGSGDKIGVEGYAVGSAPGVNNTGINAYASGGGQNYGVTSNAAGSSSTSVNYGLYSNASGGSTNWAGYFGLGNVYIQNNVGIGTAGPANKLHVNGGVTITDGTQGAGKVLTSDAAGNATWQNSSKNTGFGAFSNSPQILAPSAWAQIIFSSLEYDDGGNFSGNSYTAPSTGVYQFNANVSWSAFLNSTGYHFIAIYKNGLIEKSHMNSSHANYSANNISATLKLNAGDVITVWVSHFSTGGNANTYTAAKEYTWFNGFRIY